MKKQFLQGIDTIILRVSNIKKSVKWYSEILGFKNIYEDSTLKLVVLDTSCPTSLTIWETNEKINNNSQTASFPIFKTHDAKEAHAELKKQNVIVDDIVTDCAVSYFTFRDPDNNILEVCQVHN